MSYRAAIILLEEDRVALIERWRDGRHYFTFPGGHVDAGETPEQAAVRETQEELGLLVKPVRLLARIAWQGRWQYYFLVEKLGGTFGTGTGEEMLHPRPEGGTFTPVWMPVSDLSGQPVKPLVMVDLLVGFLKKGWPDEALVIPE
jgi:8-oxo-dGTP diphosphatase